MNGMSRILLLSGLTILSALASAQKNTIRGAIADSSSTKRLAYATISLVKAKDSTLVSFSRADSTGTFGMNNVEKGEYLISVSYVGYMPAWRPVSITTGQADVDEGTIYMTDIKTMRDVDVTARRPPVSINNDTLEFNAENFKTQPNAVVEEMLKKMPGFTIDNDGTIRVNGQIIRSVLVNGKEFFTGDPKMATKNLSADAIDKVQVFDRTSDQAQFTGVDDGNKEKAINLKLKNDRNHALFGRVTAGAGTDSRYDAQANINRFNGDEQLSFLGMGNNVNKQGFTLNDVLNFTGEMARGMRNGGGIVIRDNAQDFAVPVSGLGQNQQGVATTWAGGTNYNNTWNNRRTDFNAAYAASDIDLADNTISTTQNLSDNPFIRTDQGLNDRHTTQHRINMLIDQKVDTFFSFKMTPVLTFQETRNRNAQQYLSKGNDSTLLNAGNNNEYSDAHAVNFVNDVLLRRRFGRKGRTISSELSMKVNHSWSTANQQSMNTFYDPVLPPKDSTINQSINQDAITRNFGANLTYTEPLGKRSLIELSGFFDSNLGESDKSTFDFNSSNLKYDVVNNPLSNHFKSDYRYGGGALRVRTNRGKTTLALGTSLQSSTLAWSNYTLGQSSRQAFTDILPDASFQYQFSRMRSFRVDYSTSTTQPSITQLQPVADLSDPLNIKTGNPALNREYAHSLNINYVTADMAAGRNFFVFFNGNLRSDAIVSSDSIQANGIRTTKPVNAHGVYNLFGSIDYGLPLKKLRSRLELATTVIYGSTISFINNARNNINSLSIGPSVNFNFNVENKIDLQWTAKCTLNKERYSLQSRFDNNYLQQTYLVDMTNYLPAGFTINDQFSYIINTGRSDGFNTRVPVWNASLAKAFMKNKRMECKLSVFDLLDKNVGISRSANQNYITDQRYNVLNRYFLLSVTYSLNKAGLNSGPRAMIRAIAR
jgi:hypothetical protein